MISDLIKKLQEKTDLTYDEINNVMTDILSGNTNIQENSDFLSHLAKKGETDDELLGMLDKMQELSLKIEPKNTGTIIDMCGTGGDKLDTFNVSTTASDDGEIMAIKHKEYLIEGVQFHPESIMTEEGKKILANFIRQVKEK